ncbi:hypothetical protein [Stenotrophomonas riyadhensis]
MPEQSTSPPSRPLPPSKELFKILFDSGQKTFLSTFDRVVLSVYAVFLVILLAVAVAWGLAPHPDLRLMAWGIAILILVLGLLWVVATAATAIVALFNGSQSMHAAIDRRGLHAESVLLALRPFAQSDLRLRAEQYALESSLAMRRHGLTAVIVGLSAASTPIYQKGVEYELWEQWNHFPYAVAFSLLGAFLLSAALIDFTSKLDRAAAMLKRAAESEPTP